MRDPDLRRLLREELLSLEQALPSFERSLAKCASLSPSPRQSFEDEESFDALTSKFARISDIFTQKVLKTFVALLREDAPTFIDRMNFCEKLGVIPSAAQMIAVRDLRNTIAHEYATDDLMEVYRDTVALSPRLIEAISSARERANAALSS
jgi:hypothetical protein